MTDYISREAALDCFHDWIDRHGDVHTADEMVEFGRIEALPAADVRENVRGEWIIEPGACEPDYMECSRCHWITEYYGGLEEQWDYCPVCGADMRGKE